MKLRNQLPSLKEGNMRGWCHYVEILLLPVVSFGWIKRMTLMGGCILGMVVGWETIGLWVFCNLQVQLLCSGRDQLHLYLAMQIFPPETLSIQI